MKLVAYKYVKKHQKNKYGNCGSITISWCGIALGLDGPRFYLIKGEKFYLDTFQGDFSSKHGAPPGSKVIATPNAYMIDKVWN